MKRAALSLPLAEGVATERPGGVAREWCGHLSASIMSRTPPLARPAAGRHPRKAEPGLR